MYNIAPKTINKRVKRTFKTFRLLEDDIKKLQRIATKKKATQTRVVSELIRLAYTGLFIPPFPELDKFYKVILNDIETKKIKSGATGRQEKIKRKVLK